MRFDDRGTHALKGIADDWQLFARGASAPECFAVLFERHKDFIYRVSIGMLGDNLPEHMRTQHTVKEEG